MIGHKNLLYIFMISILISCIFITGCTNTVNDKSTWTNYADKSDGMKISHPSDWSVTVTKTTPVRAYDSKRPYITMENVIHVYSPDTDTAVQIMGFSYPYPYENDIPDDTYDTIVDTLKNTKGKIRPISVTTDAYSYELNGNPARRLEATILIDDEPKETEIYIIRSGKFYYLVSSIVYEEGSGVKYSQTALEIIKTFRTVEWKV